MNPENPNLNIEIARSTLLDFIASIDQVPTDDYSGFEQAIYKDTDIVGSLSTLISIFGIPVKDSSGGFEYDANYELTSPLPNRYKFIASTKTWGGYSGSKTNVTMAVNKKQLPLFPSLREEWGVILQVNDEAQKVPDRMNRTFSVLGNKKFNSIPANFSKEKAPGYSSHPSIVSFDEQYLSVKASPNEKITTLPNSLAHSAMTHFKDNLFELCTMLLGITGNTIIINNHDENAPLDLSNYDNVRRLNG